jgi:hypothetical protein
MLLGLAKGFIVITTDNSKMLLGLAKGFIVGRGAHRQFKSQYKSITTPPRFGLLVNPMRDVKNEQKMKDRYVRTLEST